jgi:hypothetical protein
MNELEKLQGYHKYLSANAYMLQVTMMDWEGLQFEHLKQSKEIQLQAIKTHLDIYYETLCDRNLKMSTVVNSHFNRGLTPIMNYIQWNRSKQLDKLVNE